ncbi:hypothetical protein WISP_28786 [Willisornis vidua]|uniref:SAM domain-containing protein n=1 Tax=Willisornis vidua TaxID=1566151 RepID=A0ABQ9DKU9_9PASS|nr:hypothetical protein WISP_28786 [Willisornis vidua]
MELDESFLKDIGMKKGQIQILIHKRNELLHRQDNAQQAKNSSSRTPDRREAQTDAVTASNAPAPSTARGGSSGATGTTSGATGTTSGANTAPPTSGKMQRSKKSQLQSSGEVLELRNCRPFRSQDADFRYVKDTVLAPESGVNDLIIPCHEYKSFAIAAELNKDQLQSKFASEVIRFASACMNIRTNGTIHFGVMDRVEDKGWKHGQIVGIKVRQREDYVDALDLYIEKCFCDNLQETARKCIHPPVFVEVISKDSQEQRFVVEVDIEPTATLVKKSCFEVYLPKYNESSRRVTLTKEPALFQRVGAKSEPVQRNRLTAFIQAVPDRDAQRETAELSSTQAHTEIPQDLGRKLSILLNDGKSYMDDSLRYILVTNRCEQDNLNYINFLMHLNIFCVFDFDEHSSVSGLYSKYKEHHEASSYFLQDFFNEIKTDTRPSQKLFDQTS